MKAWIVVSMALALSPLSVQAAETPRGQEVALACSGPAADALRKAATAAGMKLASDPKACFGRMQIYAGPNSQIVGVAPSASCPGGKLLDIWEGSRAGPSHSLFEKPVCGSKVSIGPKNPWGDWMLTIDGKHYDSRGAYHVLVTY